MAQLLLAAFDGPDIAYQIDPSALELHLQEALEQGLRIVSHAQCHREQGLVLCVLLASEMISVPRSG